MNAAAPRMVSAGIRLVRAQIVSGQELTLVYSLVSLRVAEIEAELWEEQIRPMIVHNVRRAEKQECRGLFASEVTVNYLYVDSAGKLIVQVNVAPKSLPCNSGTPSDN